MTDLTAPAERDKRDELAGRIDVLDKVGALRTLPDDAHVTTEMIAEFYGVPRESVRTVVARNREELDEDGYRVVTRAAFEESFNTKLPSSASTVALFPRRAALRVGMILRDSEVAKKVRTYLLDAERGGFDLDLSDPIAAVEAQMLQTAKAISVAKAERARRIAIEAKAERDRPLVERAKIHAGATGNINRTDFGRELIEWAEINGYRVMHEQVRLFLSRKLHLFVAGGRTDSGQATTLAIRKGLGHNRKDTRNGRNVYTGTLTPAGQAYAWDRCLRHLEENDSLILHEEVDA